MSFGRVQPGGSRLAERVHPRHPRGRRQDGSSGQVGLHRPMFEEGVRHAQDLKRKSGFRRRVLALPHLRLPESKSSKDSVEHKLYYKVHGHSLLQLS